MGTHADGEDHRDEEGANEALDSLLRAELDELMATEEHAYDGGVSEKILCEVPSRTHHKRMRRCRS